MSEQNNFEIFLSAPPGLEAVLCAEALEAGFAGAVAIPGGVTLRGGWPEVWRANLELRGAGRVLVRVGEFLAFHLAQLDKRARKFPWGDFLRADQPVKVEVSTNRKSKIYHAGAAVQRIEKAITETLGAPISPDAEITIKARIDDNLVIISIDSSGEPLHKRGHKENVGKAPMRETLAALFLRQCGYDGTEPVLDPMCGSGTFVIEAAEVALGLKPGRTRSFAFEKLATFDESAWQAMRSGAKPISTDVRFFGHDRNTSAIDFSRANALRAGVDGIATFAPGSVGDLKAPEGPPGLVIVNPPYGARIGNKKLLYGVYAALGTSLKEHFPGWRVGIVTSENSLAKATGLPLLPPGPPIPHGGLKIKLHQTKPLP